MTNTRYRPNENDILLAVVKGNFIQTSTVQNSPIAPVQSWHDRIMVEIPVAQHILSECNTQLLPNFTSIFSLPFLADYCRYAASSVPVHCHICQHGNICLGSRSSYAWSPARTWSAKEWVAITTALHAVVLECLCKRCRGCTACLQALQIICIPFFFYTNISKGSSLSI